MIKYNYIYICYIHRTPPLQIHPHPHHPTLYVCGGVRILGLGPLICRKLTELLDGVDLPMVPGEGTPGFLAEGFPYKFRQSLCCFWKSITVHCDHLHLELVYITL